MSAAEEAMVSSASIPLSLRGPAPVRVVAGFGFWLFLLSDIILFAALFATYSVPMGREPSSCSIRGTYFWKRCACSHPA
jgi:heme/copper-type cytochrome/quinol oxidase subunit 3